MDHVTEDDTAGVHHSSGSPCTPDVACEGLGNTDMLSSLPALCTDHILQEVLKLGVSEFGSLRGCNRYWLSICNTQLIGVTLTVDASACDISSLHSLPSLTDITITARDSIETSISGSAFDSLTANLKMLTLTSGYTGGADSMARLTVIDLSRLVLPWCQSLTDLDLVECDITDTNTTFTSEGFFARFPQLTVLRLIGLTSTPAFERLNLAGCTKLEHVECRDCDLVSLDAMSCRSLIRLDCSYNKLVTLALPTSCPLKNLCCKHNKLTVLDLSACQSLHILRSNSNLLQSLDLSSCPALVDVKSDKNELLTLDLSACTALRSLKCNENKLSQMDTSACCSLRVLRCNSNKLLELDLSASAGLTVLHCSGNLLGAVSLHAHATLDQLTCQYNLEFYIVSSGATVFSTNCSASAFASFPQRIRSQLRSLIMYAEYAPVILEGFQKLDALSVYVTPMCSIDLTGCTLVDVCLYCTEENIEFLGRDRVWRLIIDGAWPQENMQGFTALQELVLNIHTQRYLDLSVCSFLIKVDLTHNFDDHVLSTVSLAGCSRLQELTCNNFVSLVELDLSSCTGLKKLTCTGSSIQVLDLSSCLDLERLDMSQSLQLERVVGKIHGIEELLVGLNNCRICANTLTQTDT